MKWIRMGGVSLIAPIVVLAMCLASQAHAAGMFPSERGVRPLGRGGAFVAGADDLGSIFYNPAGIYDAGSQFLLDLSWVNLSADYTRQSLVHQVDPNRGDIVASYTQTFPSYDISTPFLPVPTVAGSFSPHPDWMIAFGVYAPYALLAEYPDKLEGSAARYPIVSLQGTTMVVAGAFVAWAPLPTLRLGAGIDFLVGTLRAETVLSACLPERVFCPNESPDWDAPTQVSAGPIVAPSGSLGVIWQFAENFRLGGSFHLPFWVHAPASLSVRLPTTPLLKNAELVGDSATLSFAMPFVARVGVEMRNVPKGLRVELGLNYEHWQMHDSFDVAIDDIKLTNAPGFPAEYQISDVELPRGLQGAVGVNVGAEWMIPVSRTLQLTPRLGVEFETSAVPHELQNVQLFDSLKVAPSGGLSLHVGAARFDAVYSHVFASSTHLAPQDARLKPVSLLRGNPEKRPNYVNGGIYNWSLNVVGLGFAYNFEEAVRPTAPDVEPPSTPPPAKLAPKASARSEGERMSSQATWSE